MKMKKVGKQILSVLLTVCLVAGSIAITKPQNVDAAEGNLVSNGGFDTTTDWYDTSGNTDVAMPEQEQMKDIEIVEHIVNGDFEDTGYDYNNIWTSQSNLTYNVVTEEGRGRVLQVQQFNHLTCMDVNVALEAGKTYTISFDVKSVANATPGWVSYYLKDASWNVLENGSWVPIPAGWTTHTYTYTPETDQTGLIFQSCEEGAGDFYIDNFSVTTESTPVTEHIPNGDFEDTSYDYNEIWWSQSSLDFGVETEEGRGRVLHVQGFDSKLCMDVKVPLEAGKTYTISLDVKSVTDSWVSYHLYDAGWSAPPLKDWVAIPASWTTYTYTYTPTTDQTGFVFQSCEGGSGDFYIDNFSVTTERESVAMIDIIPNGDFEDTAYDYNEIWSSQSSLAYGVETEEGRGRVLHVQQFNHLTCVEIKAPLKAGKTYAISFDVKSVANETPGWVSYYLKDASWNVIKAWESIPAEWTTRTYTYTPEADQTGFIFQSCEDGAGDFYIDNFSVMTEEKGYTYSEGIGNCLGEESDNVLAMKEMTEATYKNVSLTAGKTYKYSYQVKAEGAASVSFAAGAQTVQTTAATSEWTTVSGKFTAEADATKISFARSGAGNLLIDDVEMYEVVKPVDHTTMEGGGAYIPAGHRNLYEGSASSFADANHGHGIVGTVTVADGIAELAINNNSTWIETMHVNVEAGKEYTFSAYVYVTEASGDLQINLYTGGAGCSNASWVDYALGETNSITANSDEWQLVQFTWTPTQSGAVYFGIKNYGTASTATVYVDDFSLTTAKDKVYTTISAPGVVADAEAYRLALVVSNHSDLCTALGLWNWLEGEILVDGTPMTVGFNLGDDGNITAMYHTANQTAVIPLTATTIKIPAGTEFVVRGDSSKPVLVIENDLKILKLGQGWGEYQQVHEYVENTGYADDKNVRYYNISNGDYLLTSFNNAIEVEENKELTTGDKITVNDLEETNVFHISRLENEELWKETVVLYMPGDANEDEAISAKDLVAMKWAEKGTSDKQNARLAGTYASDLDGNRGVNDIDLRALRLALVSDDAKAELAVSKSDSLLGGEMPIAGFDMPRDGHGAELINDDFYKLIADAHINTIVWSMDGYDQTGYGLNADKHMALADKWGLKMWVHDYSTDAASTDRFTQDNFAKRVGAYSMYESFAGIHIVDEPDLDTDWLAADEPERKLSIFEDDIALCNSTANISGYMNLLPYYPHLSEAFPDLTVNKYQGYLTKTYTDTKAEMLSVDHYPFRVNDVGRWYEGVVWDKVSYVKYLYQNLDMMRTEANKPENAGKPFWSYAQLTLNAYENEVLEDANRYMTAGEVQWQVNTALALGARGIQYWSVYAETNYSEMAKLGYAGLINPDGTKSNYYDSTKAQNSFIKVVDEVLMNATNEGIFVNDSTAKDAFNEINSGVVLTDADSDVLKSVSGDNALVGCFDYYGKTAFYVVNCNTSDAQYITLTYDAASKVAVTNFADTTLNRTLSEATSSTEIYVEAGQAALVIVE